MTGAAHQRVWRRHDLLRIRPDAWRAVYAALPEPAKVEVLNSWAEHEYPFIIRRYLAGESHDRVPAGVPLPSYLGKQRIAISFAREEVACRVAPVTLDTASHLAPSAWSATISALLDLGKRYEVQPHVIGSLLWQHLTGLSYLTETSDLDLLWPCSGVCRSFLQELGQIDRCSPIRLDGEVILANGSALNWRELHSCLEGTGVRTVLVKSMTGIHVEPAATILTCGQPL